MKSLTRKFLISVAAVSVSVTAAASLLAYGVFKHELESRQVAALANYVRERANKEDRRFSGLIDLHRAAADALRRRLASMSDAQAEQLFDRYYPRQPDGTRRNTPNSFDGQSEANGDLSYGMAAYIGSPDRLSPDQKRLLTAAWPVVAHFGEAARPSYDNFYFYTPGTRVVIYGPDRPDHLIFYRKTAPANLDIDKEELGQMVAPAADPSRETRCTKLRALISDAKSAERLGIGCATPFDIAGRHVGAFGSSIQLGGYLSHAVSDTIPGASNLIVADDGGLIAYPGFSKPGVATDSAVERFERDMRLRELVARIRTRKTHTGVVESPDGKDIVAFGRLDGPNWWFLISYPRSALAASAAASAGWVLLFGALASIVQCALVVFLARRSIVLPLRRLAESASRSAEGRERACVEDVEAQPDEIGALARALKAERDKVTDLLASLEERVQRRTAELEAANREKSRFLANMSHELRTPLNGVIAVSDVLAGRQKSKRDRELAELVVSSGRLLEQVLSDILDFSKIEAGQMSLDHDGVFDLEIEAGRIARLHEAVAEHKGLAFSWSVAPEARGPWRGDAVRVVQILSNLLSNAVKFTTEGEVRLEADHTAEGVRIRVSDTGVGFDEATAERLFKRFQQADASVTRRFGGTGLGLSIAGSLAEMMGGRITATSTPGRGSTFALIVPLVRCETAACAENSTPAREDAALKGVRVLLAEDHPTNQKVACLILEASGVEVTVVENGAKAVEAFVHEPFDVVLMDMQMPEMDGLTATREIRAFEHRAARDRTPIIMLTANALDEHVRASIEAGADRHISKPLRPHELLGAISAAIAGRGGESEAAA